MDDNFYKGSTKEFDENWKARKEATYNHWTSGNPKNQIQLAFRKHFEVFSEYLKKDGIGTGKCLEVGCGRGSISSYFADAGFDCTLLDYSESVLKTAQEIFSLNGHNASFVLGDARKLPFKDETFDFCVSIGLLEHFEDVAPLINEQIRVLRKGGRFFGYIVPERPENIQKYFRWLNTILKWFSKLFNTTSKTVQKQEIYRSDLDSKAYLSVLNRSQVQDIEVFGMYPMPMISHSPEFPFSLLPRPLEFVLTNLFQLSLWVRGLFTKRNSWTCKEKNGQAFLITFRKK